MNTKRYFLECLPDVVAALVFFVQVSYLIVYVSYLIVIFSLLVTGVSWHPGSDFTMADPAGFGAGFVHGTLWLLNLIVAQFQDGDAWRRMYEFDSTRDYAIGFGVGLVATILSKVIEYIVSYLTSDSEDAVPSPPSN